MPAPIFFFLIQTQLCSNTRGTYIEKPIKGGGGGVKDSGDIDMREILTKYGVIRKSRSW